MRFRHRHQHRHRCPHERFCRFCPAVGGAGRGLILVAIGFEPVLDDLQGEEVLALLTKHPPQAFDVVLVELPVARGRALRVDQPLALEEPDLGDGDVRELLSEQAQDVSDRQVGPSAHRRLPRPG
jgi:hypothetical protein